VDPFSPEICVNSILSEMEDLVLSVKERADVGTSAAKKVRANGMIPVNFYGPSGHRHLAVSDSEFRSFWKKVRGTTSLFDIQDEKGERVRCLLQEVQTDAIKQEVIHVDMREIAKGIEIDANVIVHTKGEAFGVKNEGGVIEIITHEVSVRCMPRNLPNEIVLDVSKLHLHDGIHIKDLPEFDGVAYLDDPDQLVVSCAGYGKASVVEEEEDEEALEEEESEKEESDDDAKGE